VELPNTHAVANCVADNADTATNAVTSTYKMVSTKITTTAKSDWRYTKDYWAHLNGE
jgi:hypothetical protein